MEKNIKHTWQLAHPPDVVWRYLTDPVLLSQWLMENDDFKPVVGHPFHFRARARVKMGFDGRIFCRVLEVVPRKRLSYSWQGGPGDGRITLDSVVTWTLNPSGEGTELVLEHKGFKGLKNYFAYIMMNSGWGTRIKARLLSMINHHDNGQ